MPKAEFKTVIKDEFIKVRYANYQAKLKYLTEMNLLDKAILTDLDKTYEGFTKPMREVVICDGCNEEILTETFIMVENSRCYDHICIRALKDIIVPAKSELKLQATIKRLGGHNA